MADMKKGQEKSSMMENRSLGLVFTTWFFFSGFPFFLSVIPLVKNSRRSTCRSHERVKSQEDQSDRCFVA